MVLEGGYPIRMSFPIKPGTCHVTTNKKIAKADSPVQNQK